MIDSPEAAAVAYGMLGFTTFVLARLAGHGWLEALWQGVAWPAFIFPGERDELNDQ